MPSVLEVRYSSGVRRRCDSRCHDAATLVCRCCCEGIYHGMSLETGQLERAMVQVQGDLLDRLAAKEEAGKLLVLFARRRPREAPIIRSRGRRRVYQDALPLGLER